MPNATRTIKFNDGSKEVYHLNDTGIERTIITSVYDAEGKLRGGRYGHANLSPDAFTKLKDEMENMITAKESTSFPVLE